MPKKGCCRECKYADWDADGCTCKLDGLLVPDPRIGCKYRKADEDKPMTNADRIRAMTDEELAAFMVSQAIIGAMAVHGISGDEARKATNDLINSSNEANADIAETIEWLRKEVSEDAAD